MINVKVVLLIVILVKQILNFALHANLDICSIIIAAMKHAQLVLMTNLANAVPACTHAKLVVITRLIVWLVKMDNFYIRILVMISVPLELIKKDKFVKNVVNNVWSV